MISSASYHATTLRIAFIVFGVGLGGCAEPKPLPVPNNTAAYWVLAQSGKLTIQFQGKSLEVAALDKLPMESFTVQAIDLSGLDQLREDGLGELAHLRPLRSLKLANSKVSDEGVKRLIGLDNLERLNLQNTAITDDGLDSIGKYRRLVHLNLSGTKITGSKLKELANCFKLAELDLSETKLKSESISALAELHNLNLLNLAKTEVTDEAIQELREKLKYCTIQRKVESASNR